MTIPPAGSTASKVFQYFDAPKIALKIATNGEDALRGTGIAHRHSIQSFKVAPRTAGEGRGTHHGARDVGPGKGHWAGRWGCHPWQG